MLEWKTMVDAPLDGTPFLLQYLSYGSPVLCMRRVRFDRNAAGDLIREDLGGWVYVSGIDDAWDERAPTTGEPSWSIAPDKLNDTSAWRWSAIPHPDQHVLDVMKAAEIAPRRRTTKGVGVERLRAAVKTAQCPRPANSVPEDADWTVAQCVADGNCGCDMGAALQDNIQGEVVRDRAAQEREDHILDCYETIKERDIEIERLRAALKTVRGYIQNCDHEPAVDLIDEAVNQQLTMQDKP